MQDEGGLDSSSPKAFQSAYRGWLSMMTSSEGTLFSLASGPPTLNPPLLLSIWKFQQFARFNRTLMQCFSIFLLQRNRP